MVRSNLTLMRTYVRNMGIGNHRRLSGDMRKPEVEDMAMGMDETREIPK